MHDLLIAKLRFYGFEGAVCGWLVSYLRDRMQLVELDGARSDLTTYNKGVPQGSILGPLLFNIYTADLPGHVSHGTVHLYADDTQLLTGFLPQQANVAIQKINEDLHEIYEWSNKNGLVLNVSKCLYMIMGSKTVRDWFNFYNFSVINVNNVVLPMVESARNLGVVFDSSMSFEYHVNKKVSSAFVILKRLYEFKFILPQNVKFKLIDTLVMSQFDYCDVVYYNYLTVELKNKIQKIQNMCMRFAYNYNRFDHITPLYIQKDVLKVNLRVRLHFILFVQKVIITAIPKYLYDMFVLRSVRCERNMRGIVKYDIPYHRTAKFENSFEYVSIQILNSALYQPLINYSRTVLRNRLKNIFLEEMRNV